MHGKISKVYADQKLQVICLHRFLFFIYLLFIWAKNLEWRSIAIEIFDTFRRPAGSYKYFFLHNKFLQEKKKDMEREKERKKIDLLVTFYTLYASNRLSELSFSLIHFPIKTIGKPIKLFDGFKATWNVMTVVH